MSQINTIIDELLDLLQAASEGASPDLTPPLQHMSEYQGGDWPPAFPAAIVTCSDEEPTDDQHGEWEAQLQIRLYLMEGRPEEQLPEVRRLAHLVRKVIRRRKVIKGGHFELDRIIYQSGKDARDGGPVNVSRAVMAYKVKFKEAIA